MDIDKYFSRILGFIFFGLLLAVLYQPFAALALTDIPGPVNDAAMQLVRFCMEPKNGLNERAVATLMDYVLAAKQQQEYFLPKSQGCAGAYHEFDTKIAFPRFMDYSYGSAIPPAITRPSSLRHSVWTSSRGEIEELLGSWKPISPVGTPVIMHGAQRDSITPDLTTGTYYEYDLKRTLILLNYKGHQAIVSVAKQIGESDVGKKGVILGNDDDWNYYYSPEPGSARTGLGWAKSYIYDYFSVGINVESNRGPDTVRTGVFQWLRAGWSGINFVKSSSILEGMRRFAHNSRTVLESPRLPTPDQIVSVHQWLSSMPQGDLTRKYAALQKALRSSAIQSGKISSSGAKEEVAVSKASREQMVEELTLEYLKMTIGKPTLIGKQAFQHPG